MSASADLDALDRLVQLWKEINTANPLPGVASDAAAGPAVGPNRVLGGELQYGLRLSLITPIRNSLATKSVYIEELDRVLDPETGLNELYFWRERIFLSLMQEVVRDINIEKEDAHG